MENFKGVGSSCTPPIFKKIVEQANKAIDLNVELEEAKATIELLIEDVPPGSKYRCVGEFHVSVEMECPECSTGIGDIDDDCVICAGEVDYIQKHVIPWTTIKDIYKKMKPEVRGEINNSVEVLEKHKDIAQ